MMIDLFLAEGFEEVEALCPLDLLRRAGLTVRTVGVGGREITGAHGITVRADMAEEDYRDEAPEMVILPGGMPGTLHLEASDTVARALAAAEARGAYIAAICAAPSILGKRGLLRGKRAVCYPGFEDALKGAVIDDAGVVVDGNVVTARGMGVALAFGLTLVALLCGEDKAKELRRAVIAE